MDRKIPWSVLKNTGVKGKLYYAVKGLYDTVMVCVRDKCVYSDFFKCPRGVKQGCLLSPQLFSFFINELATEIVKGGKHGVQMIPNAAELFLMLFADDVVLLSDSVVGLQNQINLLKENSDRLHLTVNLDKTKVMVFRKGGRLAAREKWWFGNAELEVTNAYKYLGILFTTKLSLNVGWAEVCRKGKKGVMAILKTMRKLSSMDMSLFFKLFDSQIVPMLTYGAEVWGSLHSRQIELVHTFAIKRFFNVPLHSSNRLLYGETGRYSLYIVTYVKCIKYWLRLTQLPRTRLCRQAYEMLLQQEGIGKRNWAYNVKRILMESGFSFVWNNQGVANEPRFIANLKERLVDCFRQNWHAGLESNEVYEWSFSFKDVFQQEKYLTCLTNKWHRDSLLRFRLRVLGLNTKKFWFDSEISDALCPFCDLVEDEMHFVFFCKAYQHIRQRCHFTPNHISRASLLRILRSENEELLKCFAKYIAEADGCRKKYLSVGHAT